MSLAQIIPPEHLSALPPGAVIVDVRTDMEHREKCLDADHLHIPLDALDPARLFTEGKINQKTPVFLLCRSGKRAAMAADALTRHGCENVHVIDGGIIACENKGCAVRTADATLTLERQVRIAAGLIILLGSALALFAHAGFAIIPLFAGGGLVFAGLTDRCGLALLLTKAPWNKTHQ